MAANIHLKSDSSMSFESRESNNMGYQIYIQEGIQVHILKPREGEQTRQCVSVVGNPYTYSKRVSVLVQKNKICLTLKNKRERYILVWF